MEEVVRDLLTKLEGATDDARVALVTHGLPTILDSLTPGKRGELPEKAQAALAEDFVARGPGIQLQTALANLTGLKEEVCMCSTVASCFTLSAFCFLLSQHLGRIVLIQRRPEQWFLRELLDAMCCGIVNESVKKCVRKGKQLSAQCSCSQPHCKYFV
jgi:hypothetical protein